MLLQLVKSLIFVCFALNILNILCTGYDYKCNVLSKGIMFDLSFPARLTENISFRSKCHLDIKDIIFCGLPRQIRTLSQLICWLFMHRNDKYSSQPSHTYVEICGGNMLLDSSFHKSNSHSEVELNFHSFCYNHPWIFFNDTVSSADVPVMMARHVQMCLHKS